MASNADVNRPWNDEEDMILGHTYLEFHHSNDHKSAGFWESFVDYFNSGVSTEKSVPSKMSTQGSVESKHMLRSSTQFMQQSKKDVQKMVKMSSWMRLKKDLEPSPPPEGNFVLKTFGTCGNMLHFGKFQ